MTDPIESLRLLYHGTIPFSQCLYVMGVAVLSEHLKTVAAVLINGTKPHSYSLTPARMQRKIERDEFAKTQESIAFVQGTGLNVVIEQYDLGVNPDEFREGFFAWCDYQRRLKQSKS